MVRTLILGLVVLAVARVVAADEPATAPITPAAAATAAATAPAASCLRNRRLDKLMAETFLSPGRSVQGPTGVSAEVEAERQWSVTSGR